MFNDRKSNSSWIELKTRLKYIDIYMYKNKTEQRNFDKTKKLLFKKTQN